MLGITKEENMVSKEIEGFDKLHVCANNLFLRHLLGKDKYKPEIGQKCLQMAASMPIYFVARPVGKETTEAVIQKCFEFVELAETNLIS